MWYIPFYPYQHDLGGVGRSGPTALGPRRVPVVGLKVGRKTGLRPNLDMDLCGDARIADKTVREGRLRCYLGSSAAARRPKYFRAWLSVR